MGVTAPLKLCVCNIRKSFFVFLFFLFESKIFFLNGAKVYSNTKTCKKLNYT